MPRIRSYGPAEHRPPAARRLTDVYQDAYAIWKEQGLRFGPMDQTEAKTAEQVQGRVYVAEEADGKIVGTYRYPDSKLDTVLMVKLFEA